MTGLRKKFCLVILAAATFTGVTSAQLPQVDVYFADQIWTGDGDPIVDGAMLVVDGRITVVGTRSDVRVPDGAVRHEFGSAAIIPGLIAAQTNFSGTQTEERTLTPEIRALDGFDFFADRSELLEKGITTVQVSPGNDRLMPGVGGVVQLAGDELIDRILAEEESLRIVLSSEARNPPRIYEPPVGPVADDRPLLPTRPQLATLTSSMAGLRQIFKNATADQTFVSDSNDEIVESVSRLIRKKIPLRITAKTAPEIRGAVNLAKEFGVPIILSDCVGLEPFQDAFGGWKSVVKGVVLAGARPGRISNPSIEQLEEQTDPWEYARELLDAGIPVAIRASRDADLGNLMFITGQFMQGGLTRNELMSAITRAPARMMGVDDQVGMLTAGRRADFVVLNGEPFQLHSRVQATFVSGKPVFSKKRGMKTTVVRADRIYLGDGQFLSDASVVVKGKTVRGVGQSVSSPENAEVRTFDGAVIVPGFIDMGTGLGIGGPLRGNVSLQTKLGEQLYADDPAIAYARRNGITTVLLGTTGSSAASPVVAFKLGDDQRVISDPIAIRFQLNGNTAAGITTNERLLKAGKTYSDSWLKYEVELKTYEQAVAAQKAKPGSKATVKPDSEKKPESKDSKTKDAKSEKKDGEKKESGEKDGETKDGEKKESGKKNDGKKPATKKVLPDPISGTWEGTLDQERLPEPMKSFTFELVLKGDVVTGSVTMMRNTSPVSDGSFDHKTSELKLGVSLRRGNDVEIVGKIDKDGAFAGSVEMGRMGTVKMTATRTVDASKKKTPEKTDDKKNDDKKNDDKKNDDKKNDDKKSDDKKSDDKKSDDKKSDGKDDGDKKAAGENGAKPVAEEEKELKAPKKPKLSAALEPYRALFAGKIPAFVESRDLNSMKAAAELFSKKYKIRTVIVGADDLARDPSALDGFDVSICTGPSFSIAIDKQPRTNLPQLLSNEQLVFGFQSGGTTGTGQLPSAVQYAVSQGLSTTDALDALTVGPAQMLSENITFGKISTGSDADLVVLSGPPFEFSTKVLAVMIDGVWVYEREEQK